MPEFDDASHSLPKMAELSESREIILKSSALQIPVGNEIR
jgi:hypothetical protein